MVTDAPEAAPEGTAAGNGEAPTEAPKDNVVNLTCLPGTKVPLSRSKIFGVKQVMGNCLIGSIHSNVQEWYEGGIHQP